MKIRKINNISNKLLEAIKIAMEDPEFIMNLIPAILITILFLTVDKITTLAYITYFVGLLNWAIVINIIVKTYKSLK